MFMQALSRRQVLGEICRVQIQLPNMTAAWHYGAHTHTHTPLYFSRSETHACRLAATRV